MSLFPLKSNTCDTADYHNAFFLQPFAAPGTLNPFPHLGSCFALLHYKWRKSWSSIFLSSPFLNWCSSWEQKVEELCSCLLLCPTTLLPLSWRSSFIYLAFLRFFRLLLCGDQRKQVTRCINSQFNKFINKKQKVHRTCCRYSSLTKVGISLCFLYHTFASQQK